MKIALAIALLTGAMGVTAQSGAPSVVYTTVDVYMDCTDTMEGTDTVTSTIVETTCPLCTGMTNTQEGQYTHTTVYTTVWETMCSTGMAPATYTITESCTGATPSWNPGIGQPTYMPPGFTTTVTVCTVCEMKPTVTMTVPCASTGEANAGNSAPAPTATGTAASGGQTVGAGSTIVTTICPGTGVCHLSTTVVPPASTARYTGAAAPAATLMVNLMGGALAVAGAILI